MSGLMGKLWGRAALSGVVAIVGIGSVAAQDSEISDPRRNIPDFDAQHLGPVLDDLGVTWQERRTDDGGRYIRASVGTSFAFNIVPSACEDQYELTSCLGASFIALYGGAPLNYQTVSAFNQRYAFTTAGVLPGGRDAFISRYEIADFGIARGNVASSLANFIYLAERFKNEITNGVTTVAQEGYASDMAEASLNQKVALAMGAAPERPTSRALRHRAAFEAVADAVRLLNASDAAPKNKISNISAEE